MVPFILKAKNMFILFRKTLLYAETKLDFSITQAVMKLRAGQIQKSDWKDTVCRNVFSGKITFLYKSEGQEMVPTIPSEQQILLIRRLACEYSWPMRRRGLVSVGDVVLVRSPLGPHRIFARRLVALAGQEMVSSKEDETFVIGNGQCWLLADNENIKAEEANDSRTWGPICISKILGRVIYRFQSANNHSVIQNSTKSSAEDMAILLFELELDEMERCSKA